MSSPLQVRGVSPEARRILKARAAARGQSLNSYLLELIAHEVDRPTVAEVLQRAAERSERIDRSVVPDLDRARAERDRELGSRRSR